MSEAEQKELFERQIEADEKALYKKYGEGFIMVHPKTRRPIFCKDLNILKLKRMKMDSIMHERLCKKN